MDEDENDNDEDDSDLEDNQDMAHIFENFLKRWKKERVREESGDFR